MTEKMGREELIKKLGRWVKAYKKNLWSGCDTSESDQAFTQIEGLIRGNFCTTRSAKGGKMPDERTEKISKPDVKELLWWLEREDLSLGHSIDICDPEDSEDIERSKKLRYERKIVNQLRQILQEHGQKVAVDEERIDNLKQSLMQ